MIRIVLYLPIPARLRETAARIDMVAEWNKENDDETLLEMMPRWDF